jgi:hypothetical protein
LSLNVLEKVILIEQLHGQYIVISIQAISAKGAELEHSILMKVGDTRVLFDVDGMLENLSSIAQGELAYYSRLGTHHGQWLLKPKLMGNLIVNGC